MHWPNGAKVAVMMTYDFDAETLWMSRDSKNINKPSTLSQGIFGAKIGVPSILEVLKNQGIKSTFFIPGWVAEKYEGIVTEILREGHEIGHHGYLHEWVDPEFPEKEREVFEKGISSLRSITGIEPVGYRSPAAETSENTINLMLENNFLYSSNMMDDINPYFIKQGGKETELVELPFHWVLDDAPFFMFSVKPPSRPIFSSKTVKDIWKEEFHAIYKIGGLFNLVMHPQFIGRPSRIAMMNDFINFMKSYPDVWFATGEEIANYYKRINSK